MQVVRVADHTQGLEVHSSDRFSAAYEEELERVLTGLFSACPDCASDAWEEVADDFDTTDRPCQGGRIRSWSAGTI